jgi:hypothetical protein
MAFVDSSGDEDLPAFYNVSFAVGADEIKGPPQNAIIDTTGIDGGGDGGGQLPTYLSLTWQLTASAANRRDDVMLVQFLLKKIWQDHADRSIAVLGPAPEPGQIAVDGYYGPITARWISRFQMALSNQGYGVTLDGRVDRAHGMVGSISHTTYTIVHLNSAFRDVDPEAFGNPSVDTGWPPDLVAAILANTPAAAGTDG